MSSRGVVSGGQSRSFDGVTSVFWRWLLLVSAVGSLQAEPEAADPWAGAPLPLVAAFRGLAQDDGRWAYTQQMVQYSRKGEPRTVRLARFDPSQHYDEQWTLVTINGKEPTPAEVRSFRRERAKLAARRDRAVGELLDPARAFVVQETEERIHYEVPLRALPDTRLPPEKFQVVVTVDRATQTLEAVDVALRSSLRVKGVVKVKRGSAQIRFAPVVAGHGPAVTQLSLEGVGSVLLVPVGGRATAERSEYRRVTPYDERFEVTVHPLKAIDF
jgi:hypothetical protein